MCSSDLCLIDSQVKDVVATTASLIEAAGVRCADDVRAHKRPLAQYSPERRKLNLELRRYLYANLYYNPVVHEPNKRAVRMLRALFSHFLERPEEIGRRSQKRREAQGLHRAVCDHISGMTDRFAILEHQRVFGLLSPEISLKRSRP